MRSTTSISIKDTKILDSSIKKDLAAQTTKRHEKNKNIRHAIARSTYIVYLYFN